MKKIAINGFGRIGRQSFKIAIDRDDLQIVAINDLLPPQVLAHLLMYDTSYGIYDKDVKIEVNGKITHDEGATDEQDHFETYSESDIVNLLVAGKKIRILSQPDPLKLPWGDMDVDVVLECTGKFVRNDDSEMHLKAGAKRVVLSAPAKGDSDIMTYLKGVNSQNYKNEKIISNGSCTTNCVGPVTYVVNKHFGVQKAMMSTIHAFTSTQALVDGAQKPKDLRRLRAAGHNIIPSSTGAAVATTQAIPELKGKFDGMSFRVPVLTGSVSDFTFLLSRKTTVQEVNELFLSESEENPILKGILQVTNEPIVSSDIIGNTASAIVDLSLTKIVDGDLLKVVAWYDNEVGYSSRLVEMALI